MSICLRFSNSSTLLSKMVARALNRKKQQQNLVSSSTKRIDRFGNNFTGIFHGLPDNKIVQNHFALLKPIAARV